MAVVEGIVINKEYGAQSPVYVTDETGKVVSRRKQGTLIGVPHTGIIIGVDMWGTKWVVHNHIFNKKVEVVTYEAFADGQAVYPYTVKIKYNPVTIATNAVIAWQNKRSYHWLTNNCQHLVEESANGSRRSQTIEEVTDAAAGVGGFLAFVGLLTGNKQLVVAGLTTAGVGLVGKGLSR